MRMAWKPDKAPGRKREQKQRLARQQKRKDFVKNMERATELPQKWKSGNFDLFIVMDLEIKFVNWAISRYRDLKFGEEMSQKHKNMSDQWRETPLVS
jgi:hypothetical protein